METLSIKKISSHVDGKKVVDNVSLDINSREVHVVMGQNGSGKTSLLNTVMGHPKFSLTGGSVKVGKSYITKLSPHEKAKKGLFLSMQHVPEIDGITLAYFLYQTNRELNSEAKKVMDFYAEAKALSRKFGIDENFLDRPLNCGLSGGEKKQSEILQLLMLRPSFALLDEIDSGVDVDSLKKIQRTVEHLRKGGTGFVVISHNPEMIKRLKPDIIHVMKGGRVIKSGGLDILKSIKKYGISS